MRQCAMKRQAICIVHVTHNVLPLHRTLMMIVVGLCWIVVVDCCSSCWVVGVDKVGRVGGKGEEEVYQILEAWRLNIRPLSDLPLPFVAGPDFSNLKSFSFAILNFSCADKFENPSSAPRRSTLILGLV